MELGVPNTMHTGRATMKKPEWKSGSDSTDSRYIRSLVGQKRDRNNLKEEEVNKINSRLVVQAGKN